MKNTYTIINEEFSNKKFKAEQRLSDLRERLYAKFSEIEKIDRDIAEKGMKSVYATLQNPEEAENNASVLQGEIEQLKTRRDELFQINKIPQNWEDKVYICPKCKDTGVIYVDNVKTYCECYKNRFVELAFDNCGLERCCMGTFDKFDSEIFSDKSDFELNGYEESPRENILKIKDRVFRYVTQDFNEVDGKNLVLSGTTGTGKTYLSECAADYLLNNGKTVLYVSAPVMFDRIVKEKFGEGEEGFVELLYSVDLLIIDDLGTESRTDSKLAEFLNIINVRGNRDKTTPCKTIISTNIPVSAISEYYDERLASRLLGKSVLIKFSGPDLRLSR